MKYSYEEQIVGEWIDGRPIYQRTFNWNNNVNFENGCDVTTLEEPIDIIESSISTLQNSTTPNTYVDLSAYSVYMSPNQKLSMIFSHPVSNQVPNTGIVTIWYCKKV